MSHRLDNITSLHGSRRTTQAEHLHEGQPHERLVRALERAFPKDEAHTVVHGDGITSQVIAGDGNIQISTGRAVNQTIYGNCNIQIFSVESDRD